MSTFLTINKINKSLNDEYTNRDNQIDTTGRINQKLIKKFNKNDVVSTNSDLVPLDSNVYSSLKTNELLEENKYNYVVDTIYDINDLNKTGNIIFIKNNEYYILQKYNGETYENYNVNIGSSVFVKDIKNIYYLYNYTNTNPRNQLWSNDININNNGNIIIDDNKFNNSLDITETNIRNNFRSKINLSKDKTKLFYFNNATNNYYVYCNEIQNNTIINTYKIGFYINNTLKFLNSYCLIDDIIILQSAGSAETNKIFVYFDYRTLNLNEIDENNVYKINYEDIDNLGNIKQITINYKDENDNYTFFNDKTFNNENKSVLNIIKDDYNNNISFNQYVLYIYNNELYFITTSQDNNTNKNNLYMICKINFSDIKIDIINYCQFNNTSYDFTGITVYYNNDNNKFYCFLNTIMLSYSYNNIYYLISDENNNRNVYDKTTEGMDIKFICDNTTYINNKVYLIDISNKNYYDININNNNEISINKHSINKKYNGYEYDNNYLYFSYKDTTNNTYNIDKYDVINNKIIENIIIFNNNVDNISGNNKISLTQKTFITYDNSIPKLYLKSYNDSIIINNEELKYKNIKIDDNKTIINNTLELYEGTIRKEPINDNDLVNKKYVNEQIDNIQSYNYVVKTIYNEGDTYTGDIIFVKNNNYYTLKHKVDNSYVNYDVPISSTVLVQDIKNIYYLNDYTETLPKQQLWSNNITIENGKINVKSKSDNPINKIYDINTEQHENKITSNTHCNMLFYNDKYIYLNSDNGVSLYIISFTNNKTKYTVETKYVFTGSGLDNEVSGFIYDDILIICCYTKLLYYDLIHNQELTGSGQTYYLSIGNNNNSYIRHSKFFIYNNNIYGFSYYGSNHYVYQLEITIDKTTSPYTITYNNIDTSTNKNYTTNYISFNNGTFDLNFDIDTTNYIVYALRYDDTETTAKNILSKYQLSFNDNILLEPIETKYKFNNPPPTDTDTNPKNHSFNDSRGYLMVSDNYDVYVLAYDTINNNTYIIYYNNKTNTIKMKQFIRFTNMGDIHYRLLKHNNNIYIYSVEPYENEDSFNSNILYYFDVSEFDEDPIQDEQLINGTITMYNYVLNDISIDTENRHHGPIICNNDYLIELSGKYHNNWSLIHYTDIFFNVLYFNTELNINSQYSLFYDNLYIDKDKATIQSNPINDNDIINKKYIDEQVNNIKSSINELGVDRNETLYLLNETSLLTDKTIQSQNINSKNINVSNNINMGDRIDYTNIIYENYVNGDFVKINDNYYACIYIDDGTTQQSKFIKFNIINNQIVIINEYKVVKDPNEEPQQETEKELIAEQNYKIFYNNRYDTSYNNNYIFILLNNEIKYVYKFYLNDNVNNKLYEYNYNENIPMNIKYISYINSNVSIPGQYPTFINDNIFYIKNNNDLYDLYANYINMSISNYKINISINNSYEKLILYDMTENNINKNNFYFDKQYNHLFISYNTLNKYIPEAYILNNSYIFNKSFNLIPSNKFDLIYASLFINDKYFIFGLINNKQTLLLIHITDYNTPIYNQYYHTILNSEENINDVITNMFISDNELHILYDKVVYTYNINNLFNNDDIYIFKHTIDNNSTIQSYNENKLLLSDGKICLLNGYKVNINKNAILFNGYEYYIGQFSIKWRPGGQYSDPKPEEIITYPFCNAYFYNNYCIINAPNINIPTFSSLGNDDELYLDTLYINGKEFKGFNNITHQGGIIGGYVDNITAGIIYNSIYLQNDIADRYITFHYYEYDNSIQSYDEKVIKVGLNAVQWYLQFNNVMLELA